MEIGGDDITFDDIQPDTIVKTIQAIKRFWPDHIIENDGEIEYFIYKDLDAYDSWEKFGATTENENSMIYVIVLGSSATFVVGNRESDIGRLIIESAK